MQNLIRFVFLSALGISTGFASAENWPRFRGENGTGLSRQTGIPVTWTDQDYAWKVDLTTVGHSAPVIWEKTLFLTSATEGGEERFLHCLDADTGKTKLAGGRAFK